MVRLCRILILLAVFCVGASLHAASSAESAFKQAASIFRNALWDQAVNGFAAFVTNHPASPLIPEAILYEGEAMISDNRFDEGIELLSTNEIRAGVFWR